VGNCFKIFSNRTSYTLRRELSSKYSGASLEALLVLSNSKSDIMECPKHNNHNCVGLIHSLIFESYFEHHRKIGYFSIL
jgi:hypothetical protein